MSKEIDERVVEMRFDNANFERNVSTSMSTLDKLKKALNFGGSAKSLEDIGSASKRVNFDSMGRSVSGLSSKFSALETIATGALLKIGSSVVSLGAKIADTVTSMSELNFNNIAAGWEKFGQKTTSVATLVSQGYALEEVSNQLERLNWFTDETSYNFADMVSNIAKFTSTGQSLTDSVTAMEGIANWAALSGQNAVTASRAMYQLSQAIGKGALKYDDWKSIQNASMDTIEFRENAAKVAVELGKLQKVGDDAFTTLEGHTFTLRELFTSDALSRDAWLDSDVMMGTFNKYSSAVNQIYEYAKRNSITASEAIERLGASVDEFGLKAFKAAQEARTWSDVVDSVKDAVSTNWMKTFELLIGEYDEAKTLFTNMANDLYDIFAESGNNRNQRLFEGLSSSYDKFKVSVANLVDELNGLSDAELESKGYTREQYDEFVRLNEEIKSGSPKIKEYIDSISPPSGRQNLAQALYNLRDAMFLVDEETGKAIGFIAVFKEAWSEIFPPLTGEKIYEITKKIRDFTESLIPSEHTADRLKSTFKGLFAILDICKQAFSAVIKVISPLIGKLFGFGDGILDVTGSVGDWLVKLSQSIKENNFFVKSFQKIIDIVQSVAKVIGDFASRVAQKLKLPSFKEFTASLKELFSDLKNKFNSGGLDRIKAFIDRVKSLDSLSLDNIKRAFKDFKENVFDYFFDSGSLIGKMREKLSGFGEGTKTVFGEVRDYADGAKTKITGIFGGIIQFLIRAKDKMFEIAAEIRSKLADKIGFGEIFAIGLGTAMVVFTKRISDAFQTLASPIEGLGKLLKGGANALNAYGTELKSEALKNSAIAILILVGALAALTFVCKQESFGTACIALAALATGIIIFTAAMSKIGRTDKIAGLALSVAALGASLLMMASAMKKLDNLENVGSSFAVITGLIAELLIVTKIMGSKEKKAYQGLLSFIGFALALKTLVGVIKDIDKMRVENVGQVVLVLLGAVASLKLVAKSCQNLSFGSGVGILAMAVSLRLIIKSLDDLANIDVHKIKNGLAGIASIFGMFALVLVASRDTLKMSNAGAIKSRNVGNAGKALLEMAAAITLIVLSFKMMEKIDPLSIERSKKVILEFFGIFVLLTAASKLSGENASKAGSMVLKMSGALILISVAIAILTQIAKHDPESLNRALGAVTLLLMVFGALVAVTKFAGDADKVRGTLIVLTIVIATMAASIAALSLLDPERLKGAATAISVLMGVFSIMVAATYFAKKAAGTLVVMTLVITGLSAVLWGMSALNVENAISNATALSILLTAMSASLIILSNIGKVGGSAYGAIAIITAVVAALVGIFKLMAVWDLNPSIEAAGALSVLLLSMSTACLLLTAVGAAGASAAIGAVNLLAVVAIIGGIMAAISAITKDNPTIEEDLDRAIMVMEKIGTGLGSIIGGFVGGLIGGLSSGLPVIGENLSGFMTSLQPFIDGAKTINSEVVDGIGSLANVLLILTSANLLDHLTSWLTGGSSISDFVNQLMPFATGLVSFSNIAAFIKPEAVTAAATAGEAIANMAKALPNTKGVFPALVGHGDLGDFVKQIGPFGDAISEFAAKTDGINTEDAKNAAIAGEAIAQMAATIPRTGGKLSEFLGNNDMAVFGEKLADFGTYIAHFAARVKGLDAEAVETAGYAGGIMAEMADKVPNSGGLIAEFLGDNDIAEFGRNLLVFGWAINEFSNRVKDLDSGAVEKAHTAGSMMAELADSIPNSGGILADILGDNDIESFGRQLTVFGWAINEFAIKVKDLDIGAVSKAKFAGDMMAELANSIPNDSGVISKLFTGDNDIATFGENLAEFGTYISRFAARVKGIDAGAVATAKYAGIMMAELASAIPTTGGISSIFTKKNDLSVFGKQLVEFGEYIVEFCTATQNVDTTVITSSATAVTALLGVYTGFSDKGKNDALVSFGSNISSFGKDLNKYYSYIENIDFNKLADVTSQVKTLANFANDLNGAKSSGGFWQSLKDLAQSGIDKIADAFSNSGDTIVPAINDMLTSISNTISDNKEYAASGMQNVMTALSETVTEKAGEINASVITMMSGMSNTILNNVRTVKSSMQSVMGGALSAVRGYSDSFYSIGADVVNGLVRGMMSNSYSVYLAGKSLGLTASTAARAALNSNSPSLEFVDIGKDVCEGFSIGISDDLRSIYNAGESLGLTAIEATKDALDSHSPSLEMMGIGKDTGVGYAMGIIESAGAVRDAAKSSIEDNVIGMLKDAGSNIENVNLDWLNLGNSNNDAAIKNEINDVNQLADSYSQAYDAKSEFYSSGSAASSSSNYASSASRISKEYAYLMNQLGETLGINFKNGIDSIENSISKSINGAISAAEGGIDAYEDWLSEKKYYNEISLKEELAGWERLQQMYYEGSEERKKIDREVYRVQNELVAATYQYSLDWIEQEKYYKRLSTEEELAAYERMQSRYIAGSKERMEIDRQVFALRNRLMEESYQKSLDWIEEEKYYNRLSLAEELAAYKRIQAQYAKGTDERKKMDREVYRVEQEIYNTQQQYIADVQSVQENAAQRRLDLEEEYADKVKSINERLASDIKNLQDQYRNALDSRESSLYDSYGLFDKVNEREEVSGAALLDNLQGQVEEFSEWQRTLDSLSARGVDDELIKELQQMGPKAISQIKALEAMSDSELNRYVGLWATKHALAREQAVDELEGLRIETEQNIRQLRVDADRELDEYRSVWQSKMRQIEIDTNRQLEQLRADFAEKIGLLESDTEEELEELAETAKEILEAAGWDEVGQRLVEGLIEGIESKREALLDSITNLALAMNEKLEAEQEIASPSKRWRRYGNYIGEGLVIGIREYKGITENATSDLSDSVTSGFGNAIRTIMDYLNGDIDAQPTIRPVLDLSNVMNGMASVNDLLYNQRMMALAGETSYAFSVNSGDNELKITVDTAGVVNEIRSLRAEMAEMTERMERMQIVLDTGALVGETAPMMDSALGQRLTFRGRRN